jgi:hypothetical protein
LRCIPRKLLLIAVVLIRGSTSSLGKEVEHVCLAGGQVYKSVEVWNL